jgi:hypothetical protein
MASSFAAVIGALVFLQLLLDLFLATPG